MPFPSGLVILAHHGRDVGALPPTGHHRAPASAGAAGGLVRTATSGRGCQPGCHQAVFWHVRAPVWTSWPLIPCCVDGAAPYRCAHR